MSYQGPMQCQHDSENVFISHQDYSRNFKYYFLGRSRRISHNSKIKHIWLCCVSLLSRAFNENIG